MIRSMNSYLHESICNGIDLYLQPFFYYFKIKQRKQKGKDLEHFQKGGVEVRGKILQNFV